MVKRFNLNNYISIIKQAEKKGYLFSKAKDARLKTREQKPILLLRHDLDLDLDYALEMAIIENKMSIFSTYFILLRSNFYNPLSKNGISIIRKIKKLGHEIGIHWDLGDYSKTQGFKFDDDLKLLASVARQKIISGSQHEPVQTKTIPGRIKIKFETYRDFKDFYYVSDSSMKWRGIAPWELIDKKINIHFLVHPFWWMSEGDTFNQKFSSFIKKRSVSNKNIIISYKERTLNFLKNRTNFDKKHNENLQSKKSF